VNGLKRHVWGILAVGIVFAAYAPSVRYSLVFDDTMLISENPNMTWERIGVLLTSPFWQIEKDRVPSGKENMGGMYRPVISVISLVDKSVAHGEAWPFHLTNVLGHVACVGLVYLLLLGFLPVPWQAALMALLWGLNPTHTEVVGFVSGRTDLFSSLFMLAALLIYLNGRSALLFGLMVLLAMGSKETSVCLLPLIVLMHLARPMPWRRGHWVAGILVVTAYFIERHRALAAVPPVMPTDLAQAWRTAVILPGLAVQHIASLVVPWGVLAVAPKISHDVTALTFEWLGFAWMVFSSWRRPLRALGLAWALLFFLPTAFGALQVYGGVDELVSKRFVSFAAIGIALWFGDYLFVDRALFAPPHPSRLAAVLLAAYATAFLVQSTWRDEVYLNEHQFWATMAREFPDSDMVAYNYGLLLLGEGNCEASLVETRRSIANNPRYFQGNAFLNLSACLARLGRRDEAVAALDEGLRYWPGSTQLRASRQAYLAR